MPNVAWLGACWAHEIQRSTCKSQVRLGEGSVGQKRGAVWAISGQGRGVPAGSGTQRRQQQCIAAAGPAGRGGPVPPYGGPQVS